MTRILVVALASITCLLSLAAPAGAVVGGTVDSANTFSNVGMIRFTQPDGRFRCSGTLISQTVVLTAAHCTKAATEVIVSFDPVGPLDPKATGSAADAARYIPGTAHAHPLFNEKLQLKSLNDIGVVVLSQPASSRWPIVPMPLAPRANYLTDLAASGGLKKTPFTLVGYGVFFQKGTTGSSKPEAVSDRVRRWTTAGLQNINGETVKLQENAQDSKFGGGTCFGDSGGALLLNGYIVGDTSWGSSQFCAGGAGGYQRADSPSARAFLANFVSVPGS